jgi:hypothetical protein
MASTRRIAAATAALSAAFAAPSHGAAQPNAVLDGRWRMDGRVRVAENIGDRHRGTRLTRTWLFHPKCGDPGCPVVLRTERTGGSYDRVMLRPSGALYVGTVKERAYCLNGRWAGTYANFTVRMTVTDTVTTTARAVAVAGYGNYRFAVPGGYPRCPGAAPGRALEVTAVDLAREDGPKAPEADFSYEPDPPLARSGFNTVFFTDASTDDSQIVSRAWDFGDPASGASNASTDPNPQHSYAAPGNYRVMLTVTDDEGLSDRAERVIAVLP